MRKGKMSMFSKTKNGKVFIIVSLLSMGLFVLSGCSFITNILNNSVYSDKKANYDYDELTINGKTISVSNGSIDKDTKTFVLKDRGIVFTKQNVGNILSMSFHLNSSDFQGAKLFVSNTPRRIALRPITTSVITLFSF